jgi:glycerol kinase
MKHKERNIAVLDMGTTAVKAIIFDHRMNVIARASCALEKKFPRPAWVEQDPQEYLSAAKSVLREAVRSSCIERKTIAALGITNQRETTIVWNKKTHKPVYPAIVWEDSRTKEMCDALTRTEKQFIKKRTGLAADPYFSASKIQWILASVPEAYQLVQQKRLACGTVDSWLLWNFLQNQQHCTDYTNAGRTLLYNIKDLEWDEKLMDMFSVPKSLLPEVLPSLSFFGRIHEHILGVSVPVFSVCGDQQASMYAARALCKKMCRAVTKVTYGTGTFVMQSLGKRFETDRHFFTTLVPSLDGPHYAFEAKVQYGAKQVEPFLGKPKKLHKILRSIARKTDAYIQFLPERPKELVIDGGVSRDGIVGGLQGAISNLSVRMQKIYDGTALGSALLTRDSLIKMNPSIKKDFT